MGGSVCAPLSLSLIPTLHIVVLSFSSFAANLDQSISVLGGAGRREDKG